MKLTQDFEISGIVKIVIDGEYVWSLCRGDNPVTNEELMWILNAEQDIIDDNLGDLPDTHFKNTDQMGEYVRDLVHGGLYRGWVHWDTINFAKKEVEKHTCCMCGKGNARLYRLVYPRQNEPMETQGNGGGACSSPQKDVGHRPRKMEMRSGKSGKSEEIVKDAFSRFADYFSSRGAPTDVETTQLPKDDPVQVCRIDKRRKKTKIDWVK